MVILPLLVDTLSRFLGTLTEIPRMSLVVLQIG
jgi:hypothetical protein